MEPIKKVLVIEDDPGIRQLLDTAFTHAGFVVTATADGSSGLTLAQQGGFTSIILDLKMPRTNGIEFLKQLQRTPPQEPNGPILVFTSVTDDKIKAQALQAGATAYLTKDDQDFSKLPEKVESLLHTQEFL